jgi:hypothetical protein
VASPAQLTEAWLASAEFRDNVDWPPGQPIWYQLDESFEVADLEQRGQEEGTSYWWARGTLTLVVKWFEDEGETIQTEDGPFDLTISVTGEYQFAVGREEPFVRAWLTYNGAYLLWPYARAHIATITGLGRLTKLTIYTSQVPTAPDIESEEDANPLASAEH